ncbi:hypothetical protein [Prochlorococcus sp. MIT 0801]|uniref:hypothetical protein n=1 Tax=Prochlorococcus sp. MIT 0801 TaxID=1501269 RepID=UPI0004F665A1|nr:hypothetical protein [Prochlorococcus sp. MIT 0801]AIQ96218.1 hypothetical protein EW15_0126 [Prochlorococcus sp. MIT 0801]
MLRANFFKFFKYQKNSSHQIVQYNSYENFSLEDQIQTKIIEIDQKIFENNKALVEAQIVKLRSTFSKTNNFIEQIGKNVYKTKLNNSINCYQTQLKELYLSRRQLEINLEKLKGIFWLNRIKRLLRIILIGFSIFLTIFIFLSGFIIIIYLMPLIILILLGYFVSQQRY